MKRLIYIIYSSIDNTMFIERLIEGSILIIGHVWGSHYLSLFEKNSRISKKFKWFKCLDEKINLYHRFEIWGNMFIDRHIGWVMFEVVII